MRETLAAVEDACKRAGLRLTFQRLEIFRELAQSSDHPSAETLHRRLLDKIPTISLDTVYRTLATFTDHGLIHKVETAESQGRFEVKTSRHHHLICRRCKKIFDFLWPRFDESDLPEELTVWGKVENKNAVVYGICRSCLGGRNPNTSTDAGPRSR